MAFVRIADFTGTLEVVVFPKIFIKYKNILEAEKCVIIKGKVSHRNVEVSVLTEAINEMTD